MNADMQEFHAYRLLDHAEFMGRLSSERVGLRDWFARYNDRHLSYEVSLANSLTIESEEGEVVKECGSAACVLGWAGLRAKFRKIGLCTSVDNAVEFQAKTVADIEYAKAWNSRYEDETNGFRDEHRTNPQYAHVLLDACVVFGLSPNESNGLFGTCDLVGGYDAHPTTISRKMKEFVKTKFPHLVKDV